MFIIRTGDGGGVVGWSEWTEFWEEVYSATLRPKVDVGTGDLEGVSSMEPVGMRFKLVLLAGEVLFM